MHFQMSSAVIKMARYLIPLHKIPASFEVYNIYINHLVWNNRSLWSERYDQS